MSEVESFDGIDLVPLAYRVRCRRRSEIRSDGTTRGTPDAALDTKVTTAGMKFLASRSGARDDRRPG